MSKAAFPIWLFIVVALAIASIAFGLAQIEHGAGMVFVSGATTLWVAYAAGRGRRNNS